MRLRQRIIMKMSGISLSVVPKVKNVIFEEIMATKLQVGEGQLSSRSGSRYSKGKFMCKFSIIKVLKIKVKRI